jgi:predicted RNase H-like nuclease (RuvC/YqgF family)
MAEQNMSKQRTPRSEAPRASTSTAKPRDVPNALQSAVDRLEARVLELKRERDELAAKLEAAANEIATLDKSRIEAINRIDWVLDSLQTVLQEKS